MDPIVTPPPTVSAGFPDERSARHASRALEEAGIAPDQISIAHRNSSVLSAANDPAMIADTGARYDHDRQRSLEEPGFYVRSQAEHLSEQDAVLVIVAPERGQEDMVVRILAGKKIERLYPAARDRQFAPRNTAPTPEVLPHERAGNEPDIWWNLRQRIRFMPRWAKAGFLVGIAVGLSLTAKAVQSRQRPQFSGEEDRYDRAA
jgi:hypothetical protein